MGPEIIFSNILESYVKEMPFVAYRNPNGEVLKQLYQTDDNLYTTSTFRESGFVFAPFDPQLRSILFPLEKCRLKSTSLKDFTDTERIINRYHGEYDVEDATNKNFHIQLVSKAVKAITEKSFRKVVISRKETFDIESISEPGHILAHFKKLLLRYSKAFVYCWYHPAVGLWMGATPENLFSLNKKTFRTMALAGTQKFNEGTSIQWTEKEKEEQSLVTEYLENSLEKIVPILVVSKPQTFHIGDLVHLKTEMGGTINSRVCDIPCLIKSLHPTPAVCGMPKEKAKSFILENEMYDREFYTGFLGELNFNEEVFQDLSKFHANHANLYVNLRCMKIVKDTVSLFVGGGITIDSDPEEEWNETCYKSETLKKILGS